VNIAARIGGTTGLEDLLAAPLPITAVPQSVDLVDAVSTTTTAPAQITTTAAVSEISPTSGSTPDHVNTETESIDTATTLRSDAATNPEEYKKIVCPYFLQVLSYCVFIL